VDKLKITVVERNGVACWRWPLPDQSTEIPGLVRNIPESEVKACLVARWKAWQPQDGKPIMLSEEDIVIEKAKKTKAKEADFIAPELGRQQPAEGLPRKAKEQKVKPRVDVPAILETVEEPVPIADVASPIDLPEIQLVPITPAKSPWPLLLSSYTYADAKEEEDKGVREAFELYSILDSLGDHDSAARAAFLKHVGYLLSYVKELKRAKVG
jgi:hypothetical protein